ncbi:MAG: hypothetical protein HY659_00825 [Rhizobiales bacterium]|nr:hypothetical protein [Hyphomicrobiales bacterium]
MHASLTRVAFAFVLAASPALAFGQGSTGGTIGKQGKSVSGGDERATDAKPVAPKPHPGTTRTISGTWNWNANCGTIGPQAASFMLTQVLANSFNGRFVGPNTWGTIVNGKISGDQLSFDRTGGPLGISEHWKARLIGEANSTRMAGSTVGAIQCSFTASR